METNRIMTIALAVVITIAAVTVLYINLPKDGTDNDINNKNGEAEENILTVKFGNIYQNYTLSDLEDFGSITGIGGYRTQKPSIVGPDNYTGVSISMLVEDIAGEIENYSVIVTSDEEGTIENKTYNYSMVLGNVDIYDPENASNEEPLGNSGATMVVCFEKNGVPFDESKDGTLKIGYVSEEGAITSASLWWKFVVSIEIVDE